MTSDRFSLAVQSLWDLGGDQVPLVFLKGSLRSERVTKRADLDDEGPFNLPSQVRGLFKHISKDVWGKKFTKQSGGIGYLARTGCDANFGETGRFVSAVLSFPEPVAVIPSVIRDLPAYWALSGFGGLATEIKQLWTPDEFPEWMARPSPTGPIFMGRWMTNLAFVDDGITDVRSEAAPSAFDIQARASHPAVVQASTADRAQS